MPEIIFFLGKRKEEDTMRELVSFFSIEEVRGRVRAFERRGGRGDFGSRPLPQDRHHLIQKNPQREGKIRKKKKEKKSVEVSSSPPLSSSSSWSFSFLLRLHPLLKDD